jgi:hypothetical protein
LRRLDGCSLRFRLKLQQLPPLVLRLPLLPIYLASSLHSFKLFPTVELLLPAVILDLLLALHVALVCLNAGDDGSGR